MKRDRRTSITAEDEVDGVHVASIRLEWASIPTRIYFPSNGPAKSRWILAHGLLVHLYGLSGATGGAGCIS